MNLRQTIFEALQKEPSLTNTQLYNLYPKGNRTSIRVYANEVRKQINSDITPQKNKKSTHKPPQESHSESSEKNLADLGHIIQSIENPVAFATAHIFDQMIKTKDVRWAQLYVQVLDKTKKLDYETIRENEWLKQAKNMELEEIVNGVAIKGSISRSTSRRLEETEDTSLYDNS